MKRIGITGGIASGKSAAVGILRSAGAAVADADEISRALTAEGGAALDAVKDAFGPSYFDGMGRLDRRKLGALVFGDAAARRRLEAILHPMVRAEMERRLEAFQTLGHTAAFLDIPLLYESGMQAMCDAVWVIAAPQETQLARLMARDGWTREEALARMRSQMPLCQKAAMADEVIENSGDLSRLKECVLALYERYKGSDGEPCPNTRRKEGE
jgi:dephospho-CoA kinase